MERKRHTQKEHKEAILKATDRGMSISEAAELNQISRMTIHRWVNQRKKAEIAKRKEKKLSRRARKKLRLGAKKETRGRPAKISEKIAQKLKNIILKGATFYGFETDLWTLHRIQIILKKKFNLTVSDMAVHRFLIKHEFSCKKVRHHYIQKDPEQQALWKNRTIKEIKSIVKDKRAILFFVDEANVSLSSVAGTSWGPKGQTINVAVTSNRGSLSLISCISSDGRLCFEIFEGSKRFRSADIIKFLEDLLKEHPRRHLVVVMDNASCHKSKLVQAYIASQKRLTVFFLPPRSPEFNPDEQLWNHLKHKDLKSHTAQTQKELKSLTRRKLNALKKNRSKVRGVFRMCTNAELYEAA